MFGLAAGTTVLTRYDREENTPTHSIGLPMRYVLIPMIVKIPCPDYGHSF